MIHPHTAVHFISAEKGRGLVATRPLPRGTIIWTRDHLDRVFQASDLEEYAPHYREILLKYTFRNNLGEYIFCWDNGRYINHSFNANCCMTPYNFELAIRDIEEGEELTDDYGYLNIIEPFAADPEGGDRDTVFPDDLLYYSEKWDEQLAGAFPEILHVQQPLFTFLESHQHQIIHNILTGKEQLASIRTCHDPYATGPVKEENGCSLTGENIRISTAKIHDAHRLA